MQSEQNSGFQNSDVTNNREKRRLNVRVSDAINSSVLAPMKLRTGAKNERSRNERRTNNNEVKNKGYLYGWTR